MSDEIRPYFGERPEVLGDNQHPWRNSNDGERYCEKHLHTWEGFLRHLDRKHTAERR